MTTNYAPIEIDFPHRTPLESAKRVAEFEEMLRSRRTIRAFSPDPVPQTVIETAIRAAGAAPSGANKQPWFFVAVGDPALKAQIRAAAEEEERAFYGGKAGEEWLVDLKVFGTDANKPFLEIAPWLIVVFQQNYGLDPQSGEKSKHYYVQESVGLASGFLIAALHYAGLATLTHTPSPMKFLGELLGRPQNERAVMIVVAGFPERPVHVPAIARKPLEAIADFR